MAIAGLGTTCESQDQVEVSFSDAPEIELTDSESACQGMDIELRAGVDGLFTYIWEEMTQGEVKNSDEGNLSVSSSGTYIVTAINADGCESRDTTVVEFLESPTVMLDQDLEFCQGSIGTLFVDATNVTIVKWFRDGDEIILSLIHI